MADELKKELTITRIFDASRDLVWKAWTDQKILQKWWGPRGVTNPICEWDARPGGKIYIVMLAMNGMFKEVIPQSRLVFVGGALDDVDRGSDTFIEHEVTVDFEDLGDKTKMNLHVVITKARGPKAPAALQGMTAGWNQQIDKLSELVAEE